MDATKLPRLKVQTQDQNLGITLICGQEEREQLEDCQGVLPQPEQRGTSRAEEQLSRADTMEG